MTETPLEQVIPERRFAGLLQTRSETFFRLANSLRGRRSKAWNPRHYYQLIHQTNELESFLDDYGARYNRDYNLFTELVASLRAFALAGYSVAHMRGRLTSYGVEETLSSEGVQDLEESTGRVLEFVQEAVDAMLATAVEEASLQGLEITPQEISEESFVPVVVRQRLPRNVDVDEIPEEEQRIAEVASKYLSACEMLDELGIRRIEDPDARRSYLTEVCTEEQARVYEATVHNLQSAYDTYLKNTVLEARDDRLPVLRGLSSTSLHLLEAVTFLTHFYERHENDIRSESAKVRIAGIVDPRAVQEVILNHLLRPSHRALLAGREIAARLLGKYTNAQELEVVLDPDAMLHARPASLLVGIVNHYGTPVEMELGGQRCNAASILELLLAVGSHPDERRFVFRGDANPLKDIGLLFENGLGEKGLDTLPDRLGYLRGR